MYALGAEFEPVKPGLELLPGRKLFNQMFLLLLLIMQCVLLTPGETGAGYQSLLPAASQPACSSRRSSPTQGHSLLPSKVSGVWSCSRNPSYRRATHWASGAVNEQLWRAVTEHVSASYMC